jgi:hypothetical protein
MIVINLIPFVQVKAVAKLAQRVQITAVVFAGKGRQAALVFEVPNKFVYPVYFARKHLVRLDCPG